MRLRSFSNRIAFAFALTGAVGGLALVSPRAAHAAVEVNGRLKGNVVEAQTQAPVPGAKIRVSGPALIGGARETNTDDIGAFEMFELPAGRYLVEISYAGVKPLKRSITIRQGEAYPLDVQWSAELAEQEVTVVEETRHMTRPDDTSTGTVITQDQLNKVATQRTYQDAITQVASVNVSANGIGGSNVIIKGANYTQTRYMVDGLDITDPVTGTFSANINFDSIASIQVLTGGMDAEYNSLGGVINLTTDGGSDDWHAEARLFINNDHFSAGSQYGPQLYQGLRQFSTQARPPTAAYQAVAGVSGAIVKHKLWFNLNIEYDNNKATNVEGPPLNVPLVPATDWKVLARLKLTYAPNDKHRLSLSVSGDPASFSNTNQNPGGLPVTENQQQQGGVFAILLWNYFISQKTQFDLQTGFQFSRIYAGAQGILGSVGHVPNNFSMAANTYNPNAPAHSNTDDNSVWYQGPGVVDDRRITFQFDPSISLRGKAAGEHDAKIGLQNRFNKWTNDGFTPGGATYSDAGGGPGEGGVCQVNSMGVPTTGVGCSQRTISPASHQAAWGYQLSAFARDRWRPLKRLYIEPGLRADWGITHNTAGQTVANLFGIGPRLGLLVDITNDQKTMFKVDYGRSNEVMSLLPATNASPLPTSQIQVYDPTTNRFETAFTRGGASGYRTNPYGNTPHVDQVTVTLNREVFKNSVLTIDYTYKHFGNMWDGTEINQIWDPTGQRVVGYKNGIQQQVFSFGRPNSNERTYQGIDFSLESHPSEHWDIYAAYTLSWLYGPGVESFGQISGDNFQSQYYNPRLKQFFDGFTPDDIRHNLKIRVSYNWKGLTIGGILNWNTGQPITKLFWNNTDGYYSMRHSPQGTDPTTTNNVQAIAEARLPDVLTFNLRLSYSLKAVIHQDLAVLADLFNVFNLGTATSVFNTNTPQYGQVNSRLAPFKFQLGLSYNY